LRYARMADALAHLLFVRALVQSYVLI